MSGSSRGIILDVVVVAIGAGAVFALTIATWYRYGRGDSRRNNRVVPEVWIEIGEVGDLWIYPLICGKAVEIDEADCSEDGLQVSENGRFTLKDRYLFVYPEDTGDEFWNPNNLNRDLAFVTVTAEDRDHVRLEAPGIDPLILRMILKNDKSVPYEDCGVEAASWVSRYCLGEDEGLRMAFKVSGRRDHGGQGSLYSDFRGYLIVNQTSLEKLNESLPDVVLPLNLRPNIVVDGPEAYSENNWDWIKIGEDVILRCVDTNVDLEMGRTMPKRKPEKDRHCSSEPLQASMKRDFTSGAFFGVRAEIRKSGRVKLGDKVYIATE